MLWLLDGKTGAEKARCRVEGCGWVAVSPTGQQALVSYASCTHNGQTELTVYGLAVQDRTS